MTFLGQYIKGGYDLRTQRRMKLQQMRCKITTYLD